MMLMWACVIETIKAHGPWPGQCGWDGLREMELGNNRLRTEIESNLTGTCLVYGEVERGDSDRINSAAHSTRYIVWAGLSASLDTVSPFQSYRPPPLRSRGLLFTG